MFKFFTSIKTVYAIHIIWYSSTFHCRKLDPGDELLDLHVDTAILNIANRFFHEDKVTVVQLLSSQDCFINPKLDSRVGTTMLQKLSSEIIIFGCFIGARNVNKIVKASSLVLMLPFDRSDSVINALLARIRILVGIVDIRLLIVLEKSPVSMKGKVVLELLNFAWMNSIADAIVMLPGEDNFELYGWHFEKQQDPCRRMLTDVELFDVWLGADKMFRNNTNLFGKKVVSTLDGCSLKFSMYNYPPFFYLYHKDNNSKTIPTGLSIYILFIFRKNLKVDFELSVDHTGHFDISSSVTGFYDECCTIYPYYFDRYVWLVPVTKAPTWQGIIRVFSTPLWVLIIITFLLGSVTFWIISKLKADKKTSVSVTLMNTLLTYLSVSSPMKGNSYTYRLLMSVWLFHCLLLYTLYQSQLIGFLAYPGEFPSIKTLTELNNSGLEKWSHTRMIKTGRTCDHFEICLKVFIKSEKISILTSEFIYEVYKAGSREKRLKIHKVDEPEFVLIMSPFLMNLSCLIVKRFDALVTRLFESGLTGRFVRNFTRWFRAVFNTIEDRSAYPVPLSQFHSPFAFLIAGMLFASLSFVAEKILHRIFHGIV
ncbi:Ionotropic receptor 565 [Blattella germanica]|nr:Ionotropic receptor 565 [Blattella germanica]